MPKSALITSSARHSLVTPGKKRVYTTTVAPLLSRSVARPRGHRAKKAMVYTAFLGKTREKGIHTISPERKVYTVDASDPEKEKKGGFHSGGVYFFFARHREKKKHTPRKVPENQAVNGEIVL